MKIPPSDLTRLARRHGGTFPYDRVYRTIDGRDTVRGPREQIRDLMAYLQSIQEK